ncbi:LPXTG cell wall anchor domain-containing protein [Kitasatospora griseola]|uniref:LPXTG cell wall anchor domain-containing protein n=1 Tax=Kitasatospora griseola TaxID=2064 RepID=UPI00381BF072
MRSIRLLAASAALATTALGLGATTASATETPKMPCFGGVQNHPELATTWPGFPAELVKGGPAVESAVTFRDSVAHDVKDFQTSLYVAYLDGALPAGSFAVEVKAPGGEWKKVDFGTGDLSSIINSGTYQIPKGGSLTLALRIAATAEAPAGKYQATESGGSALLEDDSDTFVPLDPAEQKPASNQNGTGICTQFVGYAYHDFTVVDGATTATPSAQPSHSATASTTAGAGAPTTTPTTGPTTGQTVQAAHMGAELAETGAGDTAGIAVGGTATLSLGAGILVALRRRQGAHS